MAIQMSQKINSNPFRSEITDKLINLLHIMYIYLNVSKKKWLMLNCYWGIAILGAISQCAKKKMSSGSFKSLTNKMYLQIIHIWFMCIK